MRRPFAPGTPVDAKRYKRWVARFGSYRDGITNLSIQSWLKQFKKDKDLAARILDAVEFYGQSQIHAAYRQALAALPGWHKAPSKRKGQWRFAAMSGSAGESGDAMLHQFRVANNLDTKAFNAFFVSRSDLFRQPLLPEDDPQKLGKDDVVVLLDDFSGTGTQVCEAWNDPATSFGALLAGVGKVYLILVVASKAARRKIADETGISLVSGHELHDADNVFSDKCKHFSSADRTKLLHYGEIADKRCPKGFGDCGLIVVFQHRPPNNSIPILHADHSKWSGLFPRHD
ncbi:MAG: hypothetical protein WA252_13540 [Candidatus Sulfotelmatobacter sp.]